MNDFTDDIEMQEHLNYSIEQRLTQDESKLNELIKMKEMQESENIRTQQIEQMKILATKQREELIKKEVLMIQEYIETFEKSNGRKPINDEIITNMKEKVSNEAIDKYRENTDDIV